MDKHFRLILKDEGQDIYMPRQCQSWGYRYGPSIMVHGDICEAWFASPGDGYEADWFTYRHSEDGGRTWSEERVVMTPVPNSMDWFSVCDPAVFKYGKYYYIGYTSTVFANGGGVCNNGFVARSTSPTGPFERWCGNGWGEADRTASAGWASLHRSSITTRTGTTGARGNFPLWSRTPCCTSTIRGRPGISTAGKSTRRALQQRILRARTGLPR